MEHHICCLISKQDLLGVFRTIYLFLENQNFQETCRALRKECHTFGCSLPDIVNGNIRVLKPNLFAQNTIQLNENCESFILESHYSSFNNNHNNNKRCGSGKADCATTLVITSRNTQKNEYETLQSNFNNLRDEYKRLIAVTTELTSALENNIKGQTKNYHLVLDQCKSIYPSLFIENYSDSIHGIPSLISPKYKEPTFEEDKPKDRGIVIKINSDTVNISSNSDESKSQEKPAYLLSSQNQFSDNNFKLVHDDDSFSVMFADAEDDINEDCNFVKPKGHRNEINVICESRDIKSDIESNEGGFEDGEKAAAENSAADCASCRQEVEKILDTLIVNATKSPNDSKVSVKRHKSDEVINDVQSKEILFERKQQNLGLNTKSSGMLNPVIIEAERKSARVRDAPKQEERVEKERIVPIMKSNSLEAASMQQRYKEITPRYQANFNNFNCGDRNFNGLNFDYNKLKYDLVHGRIECKLKLMQALRLQLIRADTNEKRDTLLTEYIDHDILNIKYPENSLAKIYFATQETGYRMLLEGFSRLINTFSCFKKGRDYLTSERHFLDALLEVKIFEVKLFSSYTRDMLVATLQKLSLRKPIRKQMIEAGAMANVVDFLNNYYNKISEYCLEYACALLMNLSLERQGRDILAMRPFILVSLLKKLLVYNVCCLPYVNGTLYSVLAHEEINQVARVQDLDKAIIQKIQNSADKQLNFQLELILNYRFNDEFTNFGYESDTDEREEVDLLEDEINEGDVLLCDREEDVLNNYKITSHKAGDELKNKIFRPLTPASVKIARSSVDRLEISSANPAKLSKSFADGSHNRSHSCINPLSPRIKSTMSESKAPNGICSMPSTVRSKTKLIKSSSAKRKKSKYVNQNHNYQHSICYMDTPCKLTQDGENKYQCSCYEVIKNEVGFHQKIEQANSIVISTKSNNNMSSVCESLVSEDKSFENGLQSSLQTKMHNFYTGGRLNR